MATTEQPDDASSGPAIEPSSDALELATEQPLSVDEQHYVRSARAANTLRGYQSDWNEFHHWCADHHHPSMPTSAVAISTYLTALATHGAKVGTMSRRLSAIKFAHRLRDLPDPTENARVVAVWEGIRREHADKPDQAKPLMPPELWDVLEACPTTRTFKAKNRPDEPHLAGLRDRALVLIGFVAALRRSEIAALDLSHLSDHPNGLVIDLPRSKTNQRGTTDEIVVLPRGSILRRCPVTALQAWLSAAQITDGAVFRPVSKGNRALERRLTPAAINALVQASTLRAGLITEPGTPRYSAHSLRAGFVTYAHQRGASDRAIAHQTRHKSMHTIGGYIRTDTAWDDNAATDLGL